MNDLRDIFPNDTCQRNKMIEWVTFFFFFLLQNLSKNEEDIVQEASTE